MVFLVESSGPVPCPESNCASLSSEVNVCSSCYEKILGHASPFARFILLQAGGSNQIQTQKLPQGERIVVVFVGRSQFKVEKER